MMSSLPRAFRFSMAASARGTLGYRGFIERDGVLGFVAKPYRPAELARRLRAALDQK